MKHINDLLKRKWQSQWDEAVYKKIHAVTPGKEIKYF